jgi:hypothetical protein
MTKWVENVHICKGKLLYEIFIDQERSEHCTTKNFKCQSCMSKMPLSYLRGQYKTCIPLGFSCTWPHNCADDVEVNVNWWVEIDLRWSTMHNPIEIGSKE